MSDDEQNEDLFRNWVKSVRGLRCLKDGIETFVSDSMTDLYNRVVECIQGKCGISALSCNKCKCAELLVVHEAGTNRTCKNCLCQEKTRNRKPCPDNNACVRMYEYLIDEHQYKNPNMRNVNIGLWSTNPWEFAKGFINSPGYDKVDSAKSTDASGLLSICLNNKDINNTVSDLETFRTVRTIRNTLIHSSTLEVSEADMTDYLKEMEKILSENILMTANNKDKVTKAINSLKQLPKDAMCTNCVQAIESRTDALQALSQEKQTLLERVNEEPDSKEHQQKLAEVLKLENKHNKAIVKNQTKYNSTIERYETKVTEIRHNRKSMQEDLTQKNINVEPELQDALDFKVEILHTDRTGTKDDVPMASGSSLGEEFVAQMQLKDPSLPLESRDKVDVVRAIENFGREIDGSPPLNVSQLVWDSIKSVVEDNTASLSWAEKQGRKMMSVLGSPAGEAEKLPISRGICGILSAVLKNQTKENRIMMVDVAKDSKLLMPDDQVKRQIDLAMAVTLVYVDTNDNLDLLNDSSLWKRKLWVHMIRMPLQWEYVTSVIDKQKPSTGFEGHTFKVKLPFSWVIKDTVDRITENITSQLKTNGCDHVDRCSRELGISKAVKQLENIHEQADVFESYFHDILHMKYNPATDNELEFVLRIVKELMVKQFGKGERKGLLSQIIHLHATLGTMYWQLRLFRRVNNVWPECCQTIEGLEEHKINQVIGDNFFIFPVICLLIEQLSPKGQHFIQARDSAKEWLKKVEEYRPVVEKIFDFQKDPTQTRFTQKARKMWNQVLLVKLFVEKVCESESEYALCKRLWKDVGKDAYLKEKEPLDRIGKVLSMCPREQRCNAFLMAVITQFCFAGGTPPSAAVITDFLNYITGTPSTIFTTETFGDNVIKRLILRLLIDTDEGRVQEHLKTILQDPQTFCEEHHVAEKCVPFIEDKFDQVRIHKGENKLSFARRELQTALAIETSNDLSVDMLYGIAHARAGLCAVADCMAEFAKERAELPGQDCQELCDQAKTLCEMDKSNWCHIFLVKVICLKYDFDVYHTLCEIPSLKWMLVQEFQQPTIDGVLDLYSVHGDKYTRMLGAVAIVLSGGDMSHIERQMQETLQNDRCEVLLQLAIHREVYINHRHKTHPHPQQAIDGVKRFIEEHCANKETMVKLLDGNLGSPKCHIGPNAESDRHSLSIQCLVIHFMTVMNMWNYGGTLLEPLHSIMNGLNDTIVFLPTMPRDEGDEIKKLVRAFYFNCPTENAMLYRCEGQDRHDSIRSEKERLDTCRYCQKHVHAKGYRTESETGHILGPANMRGKPMAESVLERDCCCSLRLFLHMAMYIGCFHNEQVVGSMIQPPAIRYTSYNIEDFIWRHIRKDIDDLENVLKLPFDEVLQIVHVAVYEMFTTNHRVIDHLNVNLKSKEGREAWENMFCETYMQCIRPGTMRNEIWLLQQLQRSHCMKTISYKQQAFADKPGSLINNTTAWCVHAHVSLAHAEQKLHEMAQSERQEFRVIEVFLTENEFLQAIRFLPRILRLHKRLTQLLQGESFAEMGFETVHDLIQKQGAGEETDELVNDFIHVWDLVRKHLQHIEGGISVPREFCSSPVDMKSPASILLPARTGPGVCSYALLEFMFKKHNYILHECCYKPDGRNPSDIPVVSPADVTSADLICNDQAHDILSIFQTHSHTKIKDDDYYDVEYDFEAIQRDIIDRFLFSKPIINVEKITELLHYKMKSSKNGNIIDLAGKIPQVPLCVSDKMQICSKQQLSDVKALIDEIKTVASTLAVVGGDPDESLNVIMIEALPRTTTYTDRVTKMCKLKHVQSLWLLLELQKSKVMMADRFSESQDIFESLTGQYHERLTHELVMKLTGYTDSLSKEHLSLLIEILHEFIMLVLTNSSDFDVRLHEQLLSHVTDKYVASEEYLEIFEHFPTEVRYKHCADAWITSYKAFKRKIGRRA